MRTVYGSISADQLKEFLKFWPTFQKEAEELKLLIVHDKDQLFGKNTPEFSWCHLYELPSHQHFNLSINLANGDSGLTEIFTSMIGAPNQIAAVPNLCIKVEEHFNSLEPLTKAEANELMPLVATMLGFSLSLYNSLVCLLYYGQFLNDLIEQVRQGDDKSLFKAIRIDPTCIGCKPIVQRISQATMIQDEKFLNDLRKSIGQKPERLAQSNFQKMRLVL